MKKKIKKINSDSEELTELLPYKGEIIPPEMVPTYIKTTAIYIGKQTELTELESLVQDTKSTNEKAVLMARMKDCREWIEKTELVYKSLTERVACFEEKTPEKEYMDNIYAIVISHAESRNKKYVKYSKKIKEWEQRKTEFQSGLSRFKRAVSGKMGSMVGPAIGAGVGGLAGLLGVDIRTSAEIAFVVGAVGYIGEKAAKYLLFRNKPAIEVEEKLLRYYEKKIEQNEELRDNSKGTVYQRAFELSENAYKRYLLKTRIKKQRVLKKKRYEHQPHIYEIDTSDIGKLLNVEKIAMEYELVRRNYEDLSGGTDNSVSPKRFHETAEQGREFLKAKHEQEDASFLDDDIQFIQKKNNL